MGYPPNFKGFLKALFDTFVLGKKLKPVIPKDERGWNVDGYEIYEPGNDPGMEFWQARADEIAARKECENLEKDKRIIEDYEFRHKDDIEVKVVTDGPKVIGESKSFVTRDEGPAESAEDADDFQADVGIEIDEDF